MELLSINFVFLVALFPLSLSDDMSETKYYCPEENITSEYGTFHFPETLALSDGFTRVAACPNGKLDNGFEPIVMGNSDTFGVKILEATISGGKRTCQLLLDPLGGEIKSKAEWSSLEIKSCRTMVSASYEQLVKELVSAVTPLSFRQVMSQLRFLRDIALTDYTAAKTLIDSIGQLLANPTIYNDTWSFSQATNLFNFVESYAKDMNLLPGFKVSISNPHIALETAQFPHAGKSGILKAEDYVSVIDNVEFKLPAEAIIMSLKQGVDQPRLKVMAFSQEISFHWKGNGAINDTEIIRDTEAATTANPIDSRNEEDDSNSALGNWHLISVEIVDAKIENLTREFEYNFHPGKSDSVEEHGWRCVYWNIEEEVWSTNGMFTETTGNTVICKSTHFTAFSLLIDPLPLPVPGSDYAPIQNSIHSHILSILSSIGSAISIIGLAGTILTYSLFRCLRKERSNRLLLNLSISLFFLHLISISSTKYFWHGKCFTPSALLHFFLHASLFWMLMEAHHMHQLLISVFVKPETKFLTKRSVIAYGIPLVIVSICGAVCPEVYREGRHDMCVIAAHLNLPLYYIAYMTPVILILLINFGVFCRIFKVLYKQTVRQKRQIVRATDLKGGGSIPNGNFDCNKTKTQYTMLSPTQVKGAITVMILVGVGWIVGLLAIGPFEVFFKYLFCIFNAGQGAFIFIFRVLLHPQACREWKKVVLGISFEPTEVSTTSSTHLPAARRTKMSSVSAGSPAFISASNSVENSLTPSNPDAKDLANTLANMLRAGNHSQLPEQKFPL